MYVNTVKHVKSSVADNSQNFRHVIKTLPA